MSYAEVGASLGMTEAAVKKAAERLRQRYREISASRSPGPSKTPARSMTSFAACSPSSSS